MDLIKTENYISYLLENIDSLNNSIVIFPGERHLQRFKDVSPGNFSYYFSHDVFPFEDISVSSYVRNLRINSLFNLSMQGKKIIFTTYHGFLRKTISPELFRQNLLKISGNGSLELDPQLYNFLGYKRVFTVREKNEFSLKGDILDIFPPIYENPVRIETFDGEIERMRFFDVDKQTSIDKKIDSVYIYPCSETLKDENSMSLANSRIEDACRKFNSEVAFDAYNLDTITGLYYKKQSFIIDYMDKNPLFIFINPEAGFREYENRERETYEIIGPGIKKYLYDRYARLNIDFFYSVKNYKIIANKESGIFPTSITYDYEGKSIQTEKKREKVEFEYSQNETPIFDWSELNIDDYIVHKEFGIGLYKGVKKITNALGTREYISIEYREGSKIYVPVERLDRVHKYIGSDLVSINSLKGTKWKNQKEKVNKDIQEKIEELIKLYAKREREKGLILPGDEKLETDFSNSFPYLETEDQSVAIKEVMSDLNSDKAMDRLITGDAGYGKTEVAMRAAFKAVASGKQVALLVPTTVLASQHFNNFDARLSPFGVNVKLLNRNTTGSGREKIIKGINAGEIDVIIGTHSILSNKIKFADLGLIIIDEEQLFGVMQKEKLKKMRTKVNVLAMSATPIPRTLYMSISGIRDFSIISTPPIGRVLPKLHVGKTNDILIRTAVLRELNRGGQIIYVHNRVKDLDALYKKIKKLIPEAQIGIAHGQMNKSPFEKTVNSFYQGDMDMLICTTIIESGVDIPNANTLIVDDSNRYGLAQLYQLRGRVGRGNKRAFVYFLYKNIQSNGTSGERLKALKEFSGPGSGIKLALKDLEIRGFGTILGSEQHGNISSVGLYLYREIMDKVLSEIKNEAFNVAPEDKGEKSLDIEIKNIPFDMVIPDTYIHDSVERLKIYRRLAVAKSIEPVIEMKKELEDRFGKIPDETISLLKMFIYRVNASAQGIESIEYDSTNVLKLYYKEKLNEKILQRYRYIINEKHKLAIIYSVQKWKVKKILDDLFGVKKDVI